MTQLLTRAAGAFLLALHVGGALSADPAQRNRDFEARKRQFQANGAALRKLERTDPPRYFELYLNNLDDRRKLAQEYADLAASPLLDRETLSEYVELGHVARFRLKQAPKAIELYEMGYQASRPLAASFDIADTYQFDLQDKPLALEAFRRLQAELQRIPRSTNDIEVASSAWAKRWVAWQIRYLETGQRFSGSLTREDVRGASLYVVFGTEIVTNRDYLGIRALYRQLERGARARGKSGRDLDRVEIRRALEALPPSSLTLLGAAMLVTLLPDAESILRFLDRNDPAGYATACFFSMLNLVDDHAAGDPRMAGLFPGLAMGPPGPAHPLRVAAARFLEQRKVSLPSADPRLSTPEKTWSLLIDSLKRGDIETAMSCLTPGQQAKFRPLWTHMAPSELRSLAESFTGFVISSDKGEIREAFVSRGKRAGLIAFVNQGGEWKIGEM